MSLSIAYVCFEETFRGLSMWFLRGYEVTIWKCFTAVFHFDVLRTQAEPVAQVLIGASFDGQSQGKSLSTRYKSFIGTTNN